MKTFWCHITPQLPKSFEHALSLVLLIPFFCELKQCRDLKYSYSFKWWWALIYIISPRPSLWQISAQKWFLHLNLEVNSFAQALSGCWKATALSLDGMTVRCLRSKLALWHQSTVRLGSGTQKPIKDLAEKKWDTREVPGKMHINRYVRKRLDTINIYLKHIWTLWSWSLNVAMENHFSLIHL